MVFFPDPFSICKMDHLCGHQKVYFCPRFLPDGYGGGELYGALRNAVLEGVLLAGDRLPSTRRAATDYAVSRGLMEEVFGQLTDEGFFERAVGRGTFVASEVARLKVPTGRMKRQPRSLRTPSRRGSFITANTACREPEVPLPFNAGIADTSAFPWKLWCRLQVRAARELGPKALSFADPRGLPKLRTSIARYLAQFRGIRCTPQQVIIFNSVQQALNALSVLLLNPGDAVWIEDPCYLGARVAFDLAGTVAVPVTVDEDGLVVPTGIRRAPRARLAYVTPSHQYPTGVTLSLERRIELLRWAARKGSWIVEDDYDGEFRYAGQPLASLYSLDSCARVIYLGTLNKSMFVSLRLAYAVVPEELAEPLANVRTHMDGFTPELTQMTMSFFMDGGYFSSHLRGMRAVYGAKRKMLIEGLAPMAAQGWTWSENPAGMHLLVMHNRGEHVRAIAKASLLDLALLSKYRVGRAQDDGLFLRFGALTSESLQAGVDELIAVANRT
jgi:GntR family transcriptional regulator/MocR family aminotransferase